MSGSPETLIAHLARAAAWSPASTVVLLAACVFVGWLVGQHLFVKHGRLDLRMLHKPVAAVAAMAVVSVVAPTPGFAQSSVGPMGLPDLISDPPFIWVEQDRNDPVDGRVMRTIAFDGILHNIGSGALDLAGNPQIEGGVKQRVFDGEVWTDVGEPLVRFETNDGHNHFHLMNAARYTLWNEAQTEQVDIGDKVGFCLLDTMQIERGVDATYLIDDINYCNVDQPDSTDLRMGISPGWVDIYEASVTFQWIDVSNTLPGRYWVGSEIDPNNEIVESNEDNNDVVFSSNKYAVSGYNARELPVQRPGEIVLKSTVYGSPGDVAYVIVDPPLNGSLSAPTGAQLLTNTVEYTPDAGFTGTDSFSYFARDVDTPFPFDPLVVTVEILVDAPAQDNETQDNETQDNQAAGPPAASVSLSRSQVTATRYDRVTLTASAEGAADDAEIRWYGKDLPAGITIDPFSGELTGEFTMPGATTSTIIARVDGTDVETSLAWSVTEIPRVRLRAVNDFSTILGRRDIVLGSGSAENTYRATGLPDGMLLTEGQPNILGAPTEAGMFEVEIEELLDGEVVDSVRFTLTVRPAATPAFVL